MKKALLVIDLQNDYLWEQRNERFSHSTNELIGNVNEIINQYRYNGCDIIYIAHIVQNTWGNRKLFGFSIQGTDGAKLFNNLNIVSDYYFEKYFPSAFSAKKFTKFMKENNYDSVAICGLDEGGCVTATANSAVKRGLSVEMISDGISTIFPMSKIEKLRTKLKAKGVKYI